MNPVLLLAHNCLELTRRACNSIELQDAGATLFIIDNGSMPPLRDGRFWVRSLPHNTGVSFGWNAGLDFIFRECGAEHALVVNNDVILPPWFLRELLERDTAFVTGVSVEDMYKITEPPARGPLTGGPDFSAFLIRKEVWQKVGPFDETLKHYCGDCDYHIRAHRAGIQLYNSHVPFYHERSSTIKLASSSERVEIETQANVDRQTFKKKYGCLPWEPAYGEFFK
jgi:GT2 family glycosyltransferase